MEVCYGVAKSCTGGQTPEVLPHVSLDDMPRVDGKSKKVGGGWLMNICAFVVFFQIVGGIGLIDFIRFHVTGHDSLFWLSVAQHPIMMIIVHALLLAIVIRHCDLLSERKSKR